MLVCAVVVAANAQDDQDVVKITSQLVQVDAVVTDKDGRQVTDLTSADFQILQDGKLQKITGSSYVPLGGASARKGQSTPVSVASSSPSTRRTGNGRAITFVVDDGNCHVSISGIRAARSA